MDTDDGSTPIDPVKTATLEDVEVILDLIASIERKILQHDPSWRGQVSYRFRPECFRPTLIGIIQDPQAVCYFTAHAVMAGHLTVCHYNASAHIATEILLQSDGRDGTRVLRAFERWAVSHGAVSILLSPFAQHPLVDAEMQAGALRRLEFRPVATQWRKDLI